MKNRSSVKLIDFFAQIFTTVLQEFGFDFYQLNKGHRIFIYTTTTHCFQKQLNNNSIESRKKKEPNTDEKNYETSLRWDMAVFIIVSNICTLFSSFSLM